MKRPLSLKDKGKWSKVFNREFHKEIKTDYVKEKPVKTEVKM